MIYRQAVEKDLKELAEIRWDFQHESYEVSTEISKEAFLEQCILFLKDGLNKGEWVYWIAEDSNTIVSQIFVRKIRKVPKPQCLIDEYGYVTNVYTRPHYRNKGIGKQLMEQVKQWAVNCDLEILIVWPSSEAIQFYERAGFKGENDIMELVIREDY